MHGKFPCNSGEKLVDIEQSYGWLKFGDFKAEEDSTIWRLNTKQLVQTLLKIRRINEAILPSTHVPS
jgi:hypothetical protein